MIGIPRNRAFLIVVAWGSLALGGAGQDRPTADPSPSRLEDLRSGDLIVRRGAASRVRLAEKTVQLKALPTLIDLLMKEKDGQVRLAVLDAVTALGPDAESAIPALVHTLRTSYGGARQEESHQDYRSALALAAIGKPAVEGLRGLLKDPKENVRAEAIMALGRIGPDASAAVADLIVALGDKGDRVGGEAALALGRIGTSAVEPLIAATTDRDAMIRFRAIEALGFLPGASDRVFRVVVGCSLEADPMMRAEAVRSLGRLRCPDEVLLPILKENLRHDDDGVRRSVIDLLVNRRSLLESIASDLESLLLVEDAGVARHTAFLLGKIGPEAAPRLIKALPHRESRIDQIAEALAQVGRPALSILTQAIESPNPRVRRGAALALGQIRPLAPGVVPKLIAGLDDPDVEVKTAFLTAIGHLGPRGSQAVPTVRALLHEESAEIRLQVVVILAQSAARDDALVGDLASLLQDSDPRVQGKAIDLLQSLGPLARRSVTPVVALLKSPDPEVRRSATEFLESHGSGAVEAVPELGALLADPSPKIRMVAARTLGKLGKPAQP